MADLAQEVIDAQVTIATAQKTIQLLEKNKTLETKVTGYKSWFVNSYGMNWETVLKDWRTVPTAANGIVHPKKYTFIRGSYNFKKWCEAMHYDESSASNEVWIQKWKLSYGSGLNPAGEYPNGTGSNPYNLITGDKENFILMPSVYGPPYVAMWLAIKEINSNNAKIAKNNTIISDAQKVINKNPTIDLISDTKGTLTLAAIGNYKYNVGSVQESYFNSKIDFLNELTKYAQVNSPSAVTNASQLWVNGSSNKGMIQPLMSSSYQNAIANFQDAPIAGNAGLASRLKDFVYAFQFLYNPASIDIVYQGVFGVDPNFAKSDAEQFNLVGASNTASTINFNILLNRMQDFKYYDPKTKKLDKKYKDSGIYFPRMPDEDEQYDIYMKGTMYDVEYLLRAVLGYGVASYFSQRNSSDDGKTADMGYITGNQIEFHLGNSLRYQGIITQMHLSHVLFDERMVPIFTNIQISISRIIDSVSGKYTGQHGVWDTGVNGTGRMN